VRLGRGARALLLASAALATACGALDAADMASCERPGDPQTGIAACTRVIQSQAASNEQIADAHMHRGMARQLAGQPEAALDDLNLALKYRPDHALTLANRAGVYGMQGQLQAGLRDVDAVLAREPDHVIALGNRGILRERAGDYAGAREDMDRLIPLDPGNYQPYAERCWIGAILADNLAKTQLDCEKAIEMEPRDMNNFNNRGFHNYKLGKYDQAIADYDHAIEGDPRVASSFYMRGMSKLASGVEGGDADIARGLALEPGVAQRYAGHGVQPAGAGGEAQAQEE
jgi:tetratricopeptide (TPR) repeat protein